MHSRQLVLRSLTYYWRTNLAVVAGVATAVAVLAGALLVGDSVRGSLRDLAEQRLGRTDQIVVSSGFFREQLADDLRASGDFEATFDDAAPLVALRAVVTDPSSRRRLGQVRLHAVDERFWRFHGTSDPRTSPDDALPSPALARELGVEPGAPILVRVERPSAIPLDSVHGRKEDVGRTLRFTVGQMPAAFPLRDFSLEAQQGEVRALFVPLERLKRELAIGDRANVVLVAARTGATDAHQRLQDVVREHATPGDAGLTIRPLENGRGLSVSSEAGIVADDRASAALAAAADAGLTARPIFTYLANSMRVGAREIPYSLVAALDLADMVSPAGVAAPGAPPIVLNEWAATELQAAPGDPLALEYYVWEDPGRLTTHRGEFRVAAIVPVGAGDRDMTPSYPGISESRSIVEWDPPFPIDLRRIRPADEAYWEEYRTTPKAFIPLDVGQRLWRSRHGALTSIRATTPEGPVSASTLAEYEGLLRERLVPAATGLIVQDVRADALSASRGATDFGTYFVYFSFFLVVSSLLLTVLFFKLGIEQRVREVGLLRALGLGAGDVRRRFLVEGALLAGIGSVVGMCAAAGYAALLMAGLRSWWVDAIGTRALELHVTASSLVIGAAGAVAASLICIWWTLGSLGRISEKTLLAGELGPAGSPVNDTAAPRSSSTGRSRRWQWAPFAIALLLLAASAGGIMEPAAAFFGAGALLLVGALVWLRALLRRPAHRLLDGHGWRPVARMGVRNTTYRPARGVLSIAVIASATFILMAVDAFRREGSPEAGNRQSGLGGYALFVETLLPVVHDPNTSEGRQALNLAGLDNVTFEPFRLLPGDDASCLNLYAPVSPRILAPTERFLAEGRFAFQESLAATPEERANPWLLLYRQEADGAVPVIGDANSLTYVLHRRVGEEMTVTRGDRTIRLRVVAALRDSMFQSELLMAPGRFATLFPEQEGYQVLLLETAAGQRDEVERTVEDALVDLGADATGTADRLAGFHRVENTYLSTFQTLGGFGLLLGTVGLATVMLRNALERRRELAVLGALGYRRRHFLLMAAAENTVLLAAGLATGFFAAALAVAPAVAERGGRLPLTTGGALLLFAVLVTGLLSSLVAARVASRAPLLESLRAES